MRIRELIDKIKDRKVKLVIANTLQINSADANVTESQKVSSLKKSINKLNKEDGV